MIPTMRSLIRTVYLRACCRRRSVDSLQDGARTAKRRILGTDAHGQDRGIQNGKDHRIGEEPERHRQHEYFGGNDGIVRMGEKTIGPAADGWGVG